MLNVEIYFSRSLAPKPKDFFFPAKKGNKYVTLMPITAIESGLEIPA